MTQDRSLEERISSWLIDEAPRQLPDRVLQATFERTRPSRQHRRPRWWTPLSAQPLAPAAVLAAAAAVGAIAIGLALLPRSNPSVGGPASPSPTTAPSQSAAQSLAPVTGLPGRFAFASDRDGDFDIYIMNPDRTGVIQLTTAAGDDVAPSWSRDGSRIAFASNRDGDFDLYVVNADGTGETRLASIPGDQFPGGWTQDGERLAYSTVTDFGTPNEATAVRVMNADGSGQLDLIGTGDQGVQFVTGGQWLANDSGLLIDIDKSTAGGELDIYRLDIENGSLTALTSFGGDDGSATLSPDESRIAFESDREGGCVFVMNVDGTAVTQLTTGCRTGFPISWSPDGAWIGWAGDRPKGGPADIRIVDARGGSVVQLTDTGDIVDLAWGPPSP
jgi:Tol biopolymer transport system component